MISGLWYIKFDGVRYEGEIYETADEMGCQVSVWTLRLQKKSKMIQITAPRTCFRRVVTS